MRRNLELPCCSETPGSAQPIFLISAEEAHCHLLGMTQGPDKHLGGIHHTLAAATMPQGGVCSRGGAAPPPSG